MSAKPAITNPHLNIGAQKWTVLGPYKIGNRMLQRLTKSYKVVIRFLPAG